MNTTRTMTKCPIPFWRYSTMIMHVNEEYPHRVNDFAKSFSKNQVMAKSWLVEHLYMVTGTANNITILGSWYGTVIVPLLLNYYSNIKTIRLIDYDEEALSIARFMFGSDIVTQKADVSFDCEEIESDIIINTSCEHMWHMKDIKLNGLCALQSNDFLQESSHVNCVHSLEEFIDQTGLQKIDYQGEIPFDDYHDNKRFMLIGKQ